MGLDTTATMIAGVAGDTPVGRAVETRASIFDMTQAAEDAVLRPKDPGPWSHALRAGLAARIATLNSDAELAARFVADAGEFAMLADPANDGDAQGVSAVVAFMDRVAADTRNVAVRDVSDLQAAGVADADIVRLAELNAFLAYQIRVIAGLRLMKDISA